MQAALRAGITSELDDGPLFVEIHNRKGMVIRLPIKRKSINIGMNHINLEDPLDYVIDLD